MKIHEYQAKEILREFGVPTPGGQVASNPAEVFDIARSFGGTVAVKAQIHSGRTRQRRRNSFGGQPTEG